jgi:hypothetical protein
MLILCYAFATTGWGVIRNFRRIFFPQERSQHAEFDELNFITSLRASETLQGIE